MRVAVKDLRPNPFRHIAKYPIQREKVESIKISINETEFWDNVLARPAGAHFEIAYGHHRLVALKELGIKEVDIPIKDIDDSQMIRIMANENLDSWKSSPAVINETVFVAKEFIDAEMRRAETWETLNESIKRLFESHASFADAKAKGAGQTTILKFLGGNWKQWMIQSALAIFKDEEAGIIDREAVEKMPSMHAAERFRSSVKAVEIPKKEQLALAEAIVDQGDATDRATTRAVREFAEQQRPKKRSESKMLTTLEQQEYITTLEQIVSLLQKKPPKNWDEKGFASAKGLARIIIRRLEVFGGEAKNERVLS